MNKHDPTIPIRDLNGHPIQPGQIIAYGHALGRCAALKLGKVLKVTAWQEDHYHNGNPRYVYRIQVQGVELDKWEWDKTAQTGVTVPVGLSNKGTLQFPDRCVVIRDEDVAPEVKLVLDGVKANG
jgi:hypothetical protein